ncbi:DUF4136 domain-containing protein [Hymenobacter jeollabukensis]|uniref:DUF4136 domain-containing protein n=1 Tax=Hymenobacter jeollabukensis TaxID=2025313 RepID=A0A5R8WSC4_9BACT|nr:DUF4136 domain-containing protein [Hymenobacter jeollabukensis]TLM94052.1 DUF4136 domain-containing protein [Hymenobacter jeollabukensis]
MQRFPHLFSRPLALAAIGLALLLGSAGCATVPRVGVTSDFDHAVNFRAYKTWAWYPEQPADAEGGPAKGYNSFFDQRMRRSVEAEMVRKGLTKADKNPDVYVAYSARVEDKQRAANPGYYGPYGYPYWGYYGLGRSYQTVQDYKAGNVIIDIVDAKRKELVWRGYGQSQVDQQTLSEQEVNRLVTGVLGDFPPTDNTARR